jgi:hypothetical protein
MQAVANSSGSVPAYWLASGLKTADPRMLKNEHYKPAQPGTLRVSPVGYNVYKHRLGFGQEHRLFISRTMSFMLMASDNAVWYELNSERYTTPMIHDWLSFIVRRLRDKGQLVPCSIYPYQEPAEDEPELSAPVLSCCGISAATKDVDDIVVEGLRDSHIVIPGSCVDNGRSQQENSQSMGSEADRRPVPKAPR